MNARRIYSKHMSAAIDRGKKEKEGQLSVIHRQTCTADSSVSPLMLLSHQSFGEAEVKKNNFTSLR
jgi:hypothetical protein